MTDRSEPEQARTQNDLLRRNLEDARSDFDTLAARVRLLQEELARLRAQVADLLAVASEHLAELASIDADHVGGWSELWQRIRSGEFGASTQPPGAHPDNAQVIAHDGSHFSASAGAVAAIEHVLSFPTSFDVATLEEWRHALAERLVFALRDVAAADLAADVQVERDRLKAEIAAAADAARAFTAQKVEATPMGIVEAWKRHAAELGELIAPVEDLHGVIEELRREIRVLTEGWT